MPIARDARMRILTLTVLLLVFGAGAMVGLALNRGLDASTPGEAVVERSGRGSGEEGGRTLIVERVGLSGSQQALVDSVVDHHEQLTRQLYGEYRPRFREVVLSTREALKEILTAEQVAQYETLLTEHDERRRQKRDKQSGRDDPNP